MQPGWPRLSKLSRPSDSAIDALESIPGYIQCTLKKYLSLSPFFPTSPKADRATAHAAPAGAVPRRGGDPPPHPPLHLPLSPHPLLPLLARSLSLSPRRGRQRQRPPHAAHVRPHTGHPRPWSAANGLRQWPPARLPLSVVSSRQSTAAVAQLRGCICRYVTLFFSYFIPWLLPRSPLPHGRAQQQAADLLRCLCSRIMAAVTRCHGGWPAG